MFMKFYYETRPLYLEADLSGIGLGTRLLQIRDKMNFPQAKAPHNSILRLIAFANKSLSSADRRYNNIETEAFGIQHGIKKCHHYCSAREVGITHGSQAAGSNLQDGCSHTIPETSTHTMHASTNAEARYYTS